MIAMQMGDENVIDPGETNVVFPHLGLGSFTAIDQKKPPGRESRLRYFLIFEGHS